MNTPPSQILRKLLNKNEDKSLILEVLEEIHVLNPDWFKKKSAASSFQMLFKAGHFDAAKKMHDLGFRANVEKYRSRFSSVFCMLREEHMDMEDDPDIIRGYFTKSSYDVTGSFQTPDSAELNSLPLVHDLKALANFFFDANAAPYSQDDRKSLWRDQVIVKLDVKKLNKDVRKEVINCVFEQNGLNVCAVLGKPLRKVFTEMVHDFTEEEKRVLLNRVVKDYQPELGSRLFLDQEQAVMLVDVLCDHNYEGQEFKHIFENNRGVSVFHWYFQNDHFFLLDEPSRSRLIHCFNHQDVLKYSTPGDESKENGSHPHLFYSKIVGFMQESVDLPSLSFTGNSFNNVRFLNLAQKSECLLQDFKALIDIVVSHPRLNAEAKKNWLSDLKMINASEIYNQKEIKNLSPEQADRIQKVISEWNHVVLPYTLKKADLRLEPDKGHKKPALSQGVRF